MGLERLAVVVQDVDTVFDIDTKILNERKIIEGKDKHFSFLCCILNLCMLVSFIFIVYAIGYKK